MLFEPPLESRIHTLELPVGGSGYSGETVRLVFDFVNLANDLVISQSKLKEVAEDKTGDASVAHLTNASDIIARICSSHNGSLGLHPAVYFYSMSGRYQPTAFLAAVKLIMEFEKENKLVWFTDNRRQFEEFLVNHRYFVNQIVGQFGSGIKGYNWVVTLYKEILTMISEGKESEMVSSLINIRKWRLKELVNSSGKGFSSETKNYIVLKDSLAKANTCGICGARIHRNAYQIDHINRKADGGPNTSDNGQMVHPFCNTTYKERFFRKQQ